MTKDIAGTNSTTNPATGEPAELRPLLTANEAAAQLGVTAKALESWRGAGTGPAYIKLSGKFIRYRHEDLDAFVATHRRHSTAQGG